MNRRIVRFGLVAVAVAVVVAIGLNLRPASNSGAQVTSSPRPSTSPGATLGKLAYQLDGDIYVADGEGSDPVRIADGRPAHADGLPIGYWGPVWSPDGRYLAYRKGIDTVLVTDAEGHLVASLPGISLHTVSWSPDSTRIATWLSLSQGPYRIGIYGLDGVRQTLLTMPRGFRGPNGDPVWSPDGASLQAPAYGVTMPVDGRKTTQAAGARLALAGVGLVLARRNSRRFPTRDWAEALDPGRYSALRRRGRWLSGPQAGPRSGRERRLVAGGRSDRLRLPDGQRGAHLGPPDQTRCGRVARGTVTTLTGAGAQDHAIRFSPDGQWILFSRRRQRGELSLEHRCRRLQSTPLGGRHRSGRLAVPKSDAVRQGGGHERRTTRDRGGGSGTRPTELASPQP